jgi:pyridoxamine 5'-phosphate oxidase
MTGPAGPDPLTEIAAARERARVAGDPFTDLCVLATADGAGPPGVRTLVLRDVGAQGVGLLVSQTSPKWAPLLAGQYECLLVWLSIRRQYRIRGRLGSMPAPLVEEYWRQKGHASRLLDLYYSAVQAQSSPVPSRARFLEGIEALRHRHPEPDGVPMPPSLAGVYLLPDRIEAWHGSPDRLHDRHAYRREAAGWVEEILVP